MNKKNIILNLRNQGKTYTEIHRETGISKGTISYHCGINVRKKQNIRQEKSRVRNQRQLKIDAGGKCCKCGYNKCLNALHFHHKNPNEKDFNIASSLRKYSINKVRKEVEKCILLCSNCHAELHSGLFNI